MSKEEIGNGFFPITEVVLGSDPEVFVYDTKTNKIVISLDKIGGTKKFPKPLGKDGFFVQEDNVLAEFNIPISKTREAFVANIEDGIKLVGAGMPDGLIPLIKSSHRFEMAEFNEDERAFEMGCDPDANAWTEKVNDAPDVFADPGLRSGGGHIHIGYKNPYYAGSLALIRLMDVFLGVPSVILDTDTDRRKLYGKAGAHRHKSYGVEYRTLSSFWLKSKELTGWAWDNTHEAINTFNTGDLSLIKDGERIRGIIDNGNRAEAEKFVAEYMIPMPAVAF